MLKLKFLVLSSGIQEKKMRVNDGKLNIRSETLKAMLDYVNVLMDVLKMGLFWRLWLPIFIIFVVALR